MAQIAYPIWRAYGSGSPYGIVDFGDFNMHFWPNFKLLYSGDSVFLVHGNACETLINDLETQRLDHA